MPRKKLIRSPIDPYHVTARCINKEWFRLPLPIVWKIFSNYLFFISYAYKVRIVNFVLMDNHFHLILVTPQSNLDQAMNYFMREVSRSITNQAGRINQTFGGPYHWCIIRDYKYLLNAYKYVYQNPVAAGLSELVESYEYSSLNRLLGNNPLGFPCYDELLFDDLEYRLDWMNKQYSEKEKGLIQSALRKTTFSFPRSRKDGKEQKV